MELWDILDENGNKTGRTYVRGSGVPFKDGEYHLVVCIWILNSKGEFLISKRTPNKNFPNMWESTGGAAVAGDDSLQTALKEVKEELGIELDPKNGKMMYEFKFHNDDDKKNSIHNVWLFTQDVNIEDVVFQENETCDALLADSRKILDMLESGEFTDKTFFPYLDELFEYCEKLVVKDGLLTKVDNFKFVNPAKSLSGYKSEMSLSQVVTFFERQGIIFTKTMIQHYMKSGFLPPLINKRYYNKRHIYMLSIIHILKDIYSLDDIKTIFSDLLSGENFEAVYDTFISLYEEAISGWKADLPEAVKNLTASEFDSENTVESAKRQDTVLASLLMAHSAAAKELAKLAIGK